MVEVPVLTRPHLVLADAGDDDRALGCTVAHLFQAELRLQCITGCTLLVVQRELLHPSVDAAAPRSDVDLGDAAGREFLDRHDDFFDDETAVADDRHVGTAHLALFGRVDVDVDDLRFGCERRHLAGDAVVEACTECDEQVALLHRRDRSCRAVHAGHAEAQRMVVGECTAPPSTW